MQVNSVKLYNSNACSFRAKQNTKPKEEYENPIDRKTEKNLAILGSVGGSALAGITAFGITSCLTEAGNRKFQGIVGLITAGVVLALTLPSALYNAKVGSFMREKEMDVYSRKNEAQKNIYGGLNEQVKDEKVPLNESIQNYATLVMAENGKGLMIKGA